MRRSRRIVRLRERVAVDDMATEIMDYGDGGEIPGEPDDICRCFYGWPCPDLDWVTPFDRRDLQGAALPL